MSGLVGIVQVSPQLVMLMVVVADEEAIGAGLVEVAVGAKVLELLDSLLV